MTKVCAWLAVGALLLGVNVGRSQEIVHGADQVQALAASCLECAPGCQPSCHEHHSLWRWLTYHPEHPGLCDCCHKCKPCCDPPPYLFFLCEGCGGGSCGPCNGDYTCATCACSGEPAHRIYHCHPEKNCHEGACSHP